MTSSDMGSLSLDDDSGDCRRVASGQFPVASSQGGQWQEFGRFFLGTGNWELATRCNPRMPVSACPDCGHDVSTLAPVCPHCGRPMNAVPSALQPPPPNTAADETRCPP